MKEQNKAKAKSLLSMAIIFAVCFSFQADLVSYAEGGNETDSYSVSNETTGPDSENNSTTESNDTTAVENNNEANLNNISYIEAVTGANVAGSNTGSGLITTDDANGSGEIVNVVNKNVFIPPEDEDIVINAENSETGPGSENNTEVSVNDETTVNNNNISYTANEIFANINSGSNISDYNTGHGIVISGNANLGLNMINLANTNLFGSNVFDARWLNIYENYGEDIVFEKSGSSNLAQLIINAANESTGPMSTNNIIIDVNDSTEIINNNTGELKNKVEATVSSGRNSTSTNTGSGTIVTGDVNAALNSVNFLNTNISSSNWWLNNLNVFGNWDGDIVLPAEIFNSSDLSAEQITAEENSTNENTGPLSENETEINVGETFEVDNYNEVVITNNINLNANTGGNETSYNGGTGQSDEGSVQAESTVANVANLNITGTSWWVVIVNKFGSWNGTIEGTPQGSQMQNNEEAIILTPQNSGIQLTNSSTGPLSDNSIAANVNYSTDIENVNSAKIVNDFTIDAITGENKASINTGHGYIDTGDVRAATNTVNFANSNISVGNFLVSVVNVFGNWTGNLIFPDSVLEGDSMSAQGNSGSNEDSLSSSNDTTGYNSENNSSNETNNSTNIENNNTADVDNNVSASSSTGLNSASYNTGSGVVATGEASTDLSISNEVNTNAIEVNNSGGGVSGDASNGTTGANSENGASNETGNNTTIINNNDIVADSDIDVSTSTGNNTADYNTGSGTIDTGDAETIVDLVNQFNNNEIDVDTFGELLEQETSNNTTGPDSENSSNTAANNDTIITNNNSAELNNDYSITNETGDNHSNYNLGNGDIGTGNASIEGEIETAANSSNVNVGAADDSTGVDNEEENADNVNNGASSDSGDSNNSSGENSPGDSSNDSNPSENSSDSLNNSGESDDLSGIAKGISTVFGDLNGNGKVDDYDFSILMANWGEFFTDARADANNDGKVDDYDFSIVMGSWGKTTALACK